MSSKQTYYQPLMCTQEEALLTCTPYEVQPWCNFVLFDITDLPGFTISKQQLRKESASNPSSFRVVLENQTNKSISVKQFLYDWAPPAYDYPCLWLNREKYSSTDFAAPRSIVVKDRVLWIGKNYRGQNAATMDLERTRIEITFDKISLSDDELIQFIQEWKPCDEKRRQDILNTPLGHLSYYFRHRKNASIVPLSYWKHTRLESCFGQVLSWSDEIGPPAIENALNQAGYQLNSILGIVTATNEIVEKEWLFEHKEKPGVLIHMLTTPHHSIRPIPFPPKIGDQVCLHGSKVISGTEVYWAHPDQKHGNCELIWRTDTIIHLMIIRAVPGMDIEWALDLIANSLRT